jgi:hypothetical protein
MEETPNFYLMFGRLEGKVDALLSQQRADSKRLDDHETRITELERLKDRGTGALASLRWVWVIVAAGFGAYADTIKHWIMK